MHINQDMMFPWNIKYSDYSYLCIDNYNAMYKRKMGREKEKSEVSDAWAENSEEWIVLAYSGVKRCL